MKDFKFYREYANIRLEKRFEVLSNDHTNPLFGMTLSDVYQEVKGIDNKIRPDIIRRQTLLAAVEVFLDYIKKHKLSKLWKS